MKISNPLPFFICILFSTLFSGTMLASTDSDSTKVLAGHCNPIIQVNVNCADHTLELTAIVQYVFTGMLDPVTVQWNTGEIANKITVTPPGSWNWDPSATGCEVNHWDNTYDQPGAFFTGNLEILGSGIICAGIPDTLLVESGGYDFQNFDWSPENPPNGAISPYPVSEPGLYVLNVLDDLGCPFSAQIDVDASGIIVDTPEQTYCAGDSVVLNGQLITQSAVVTDTLPSTTGGCDTLIRHTLTFLPYEQKQETLRFCPGTSVTIGGQAYDQAGTVLDTIQGFTGCDTVVTYTLLYHTPAPSNLSIQCPNSILITVPDSISSIVVPYNLPAALTDCVCPGTQINRLNGPASGSNFPIGFTNVCYTARDSCGQTNSCCFGVTIEADPGPACDTKVNGCIRYELLSIKEDAGNNRTYRMRVVNDCPAPMVYASFEIPKSLVAIAPLNGSTYTAPSGNPYLVRSPSLSKFYSIQFKATGHQISHGESDIFEYTLPAQAQVLFIRAVVGLEFYTYVETILNTFNCPIGISAPEQDILEDRENADQNSADLLFYPNPATQTVQFDRAEGAGSLMVQDALGHIVLQNQLDESQRTFSVAGLPSGVYRVLFKGSKSVRTGLLNVIH